MRPGLLPMSLEKGLSSDDCPFGNCVSIGFVCTSRIFSILTNKCPKGIPADSCASQSPRDLKPGCRKPPLHPRSDRAHEKVVAVLNGEKSARTPAASPIPAVSGLCRSTGLSGGRSKHGAGALRHMVRCAQQSSLHPIHVSG